MAGKNPDIAISQALAHPFRFALIGLHPTGSKICYHSLTGSDGCKRPDDTPWRLKSIKMDISALQQAAVMTGTEASLIISSPVAQYASIPFNRGSHQA